MPAVLPAIQGSNPSFSLSLRSIHSFFNSTYIIIVPGIKIPGSDVFCGYWQKSLLRYRNRGIAQPSLVGVHVLRTAFDAAFFRHLLRTRESVRIRKILRSFKFR